MRTPSSLLATLPLALVLAACGGGGGGAPQATAPATATIAGHAVKGPVAGATVTAYALDGGVMGAQLAQGMTAGDGAYSLTVPANAGAIMLRMTGGSYVDEATGATVTMAPGQAMGAIMASLSASEPEIEITPLTSMAQAMAAVMPGGMSPANIAAANSAVGAYFMVPDILRTMPMNPGTAGSGAAASAGSINYGMTLAAMSQYAKDAGMPSSTMMAAFVADASDGVFNGQSGATPVTMGGGMMSGGMMPAAAGGTGLAAAMLEFMNSGANRSGAGAATMGALMQHLQVAGGVVH